MNLRSRLPLLAGGLLALTVSVQAREPATPTNVQRFEALKKLAGNWVEVGKDGKPTDKIISSIRVTSAGSALLERLMPGTAHEMITMYTLDGTDLVLTHYCALGNQPRMRAEPGDLHRIAFKFIGAGNLKSKDDQHMHQATLTIIDNNHFKSEWMACKEGSPCHHVTFNLVRKAR